jgi:cytochrome c oxidase cbb3-type subunit 2
MPAYPWLEKRDASQTGNVTAKLRALRTLGHPYTDEDVEAAEADLDGLKEMDALIAYLQILGTSYSEETAL